MKVLVCGAGQVGMSIARYLCTDANDVTVIDQRTELIHKIQDQLDVRTVCGHASHPDVLDKAGAGDADVLVAVTHADEVNMVACQVAHSLFDVPIKIARVRDQLYLQSAWRRLLSPDNLPIDVVISPEIEVARAIARRLKSPGLNEVIPLADGKVQLLGLRCTDKTPVVNTPLRQIEALFPDLQMVIIGIVRDGKPMLPSGEDQMLAGDDVYVVVPTTLAGRVKAAFGQEDTSIRRVVILGGGNVGLSLAQMIDDERLDISAKIIESDRTRAEFVAKTVTRSVVLHGDARDSEILEEAGASAAEAIVAVTNDDETNILASLLGKRHGAKRSICLLNKTAYNALVGSLGIDAVVTPPNITISTILLHVRRGRIHAVHSLNDGFGELVEADALDASSLVGKPLKHLKLPQGVRLGAVVRGDEVVIPSRDTVIHGGNRVILFALSGVMREAESLFSLWSR